MSLLSRSPCPCLLTSGFPDADCTTCGGTGYKPAGMRLDDQTIRDTFGEPARVRPVLLEFWDVGATLLLVAVVSFLCGWIGKGWRGW